jgi:hypothetical protein
MELLFYTILLSPVLASGAQGAKQPQKPGKNYDYITVQRSICKVWQTLPS